MSREEEDPDEARITGKGFGNFEKIIKLEALDPSENLKLNPLPCPESMSLNHCN